MLKFRKDHPEIEIRNPDYPAGAVMWSAHRDGVILCAEFELRVLLDRCEWLLRDGAW